MRNVLISFGLILVWAFAVIAAVLAEATWFPAPDVARGDFAAIENYLVEKLRAAEEGKRLGSASLVLVQNGELASRHGFGVSDMETREPVDTGKTLYQMASVSKAVTAWGVMKLVEEGRIDLDQPVVRYLTRWRFPGSDEHREKVTVRHLLSHTAGIDEGSGLRGFLPGERMQTLEEALTGIDGSTGDEPRGVRVVSEPGKWMSYGNANYAILQLMIEEVTGRPFSDYMKETVLLPLGMTNANFGMDALAAEGRERHLAPNFDSSLNELPRRRYTATSAVALYATAEDIAQFARAFSGQNPVLKPETLKQMMTPQAGTSGTWGLGPTLFIENDAGGHVVGHAGGAYPAWGAMLRTNPASGNGFVLLVSGGSGTLNRLPHDWIYWEMGKMPFEGRRQLVYDRLLKGAGMVAIIFGSIVIVLWRFWSYRRLRGAR